MSSGAPSEYGTALAVVVVTCSPGRALDGCLDSLATATTVDHLVVLADNGSVDGAPEAAAERRAAVTLLRIGEDVGYGAAANRAIAGLPAGVGWIVVSSPWATWRSGSIDELLAAGDRWPRAGALGPTVTGEPLTDEPVGDRVGGAGGERRVKWLPGCALLLRRAALDSVDGFDPGYREVRHDVDLGERLARAGWLNIAVPGAGVLHDPPAPFPPRPPSATWRRRRTRQAHGRPFGNG